MLSDTIVLLLLLLPCEIHVPQCWQGQFLESLKRVNARLEIASPHEYYAFWPDEYSYSRYHLRELADAPPIEAAERFRPYDPAWRRFREEYRENMLMRQDLEPHRCWYYDTVLAEIHTLEQIQELVRTANDVKEPWVGRRCALRQLRQMLGEDAWEQGLLPPPVPLWRFTSMD